MREELANLKAAVEGAKAKKGKGKAKKGKSKKSKKGGKGGKKGKKTKDLTADRTPMSIYEVCAMLSLFDECACMRAEIIHFVCVCIYVSCALGCIMSCVRVCVSVCIR